MTDGIRVPARNDSWSVCAGTGTSRRVLIGCLVGLALLVASGLRLADLGLRPMHHDEANQAVKFGTLLETGQYHYDRDDHHGPTLYFLTLPVAWLRGQTTLADLDEATVRLVPAVFGVGCVLLIPLLGRQIGWPAAVAGTWLAALSPALTYYSRCYIQESLLVFFGFVCVGAIGWYTQRPRLSTAVVAGLAAGLAFATKETSVIIIGAAGLAVAVAVRRVDASNIRIGHGVAACGAATFVAIVFYSSGLRDVSGVFESVWAFTTYVDRGVAPDRHGQPWDYYLRLLTWHRDGGVWWSEGLIGVLALAGVVTAIRRPAFWPRYVAVYTVITTVAFSWLRYKTPWNALPFLAGAVILAGIGAGAWFDAATRRWQRVVIGVLLAGAAMQLGQQNWRANFRYPADPRNPYVYAHTVPDLLRLVTRVREISATAPRGTTLAIGVIAGPYEQWPLPWYFRRLPRVGYWTTVSDETLAAGLPVIVAADPMATILADRLGDRYVSEYYGLRPGVLLTVFIEQSTWQRFLATR